MSHEPAQNRTETASDAQEAPEVIRELQAARETKWAERLHASTCRGGNPAICSADGNLAWDLWAEAGMALAAEETFEATSALRQELAQAQAENERLREAYVIAVDEARALAAEPTPAAFPTTDESWEATPENMALLRQPTPAAEPHAEDGAVCAKDVGDPPEVCRCLLPRGHAGLHECKHKRPAPVADPDDTKDGQR